MANLTIGFEKNNYKVYFDACHHLIEKKSVFLFFCYLNGL